MHFNTQNLLEMFFLGSLCMCSSELTLIPEDVCDRSPYTQTC